MKSRRALVVALIVLLWRRCRSALSPTVSPMAGDTPLLGRSWPSLTVRKTGSAPAR